MTAQMTGTEKQQKKAINYYNKLSVIYDYISISYYRKSRAYAIRELQIQPGHTILNLPCGTGVNFKHMQEELHNSGHVIGIDLSIGMLHQAQKKIEKHNWTNINLKKADATHIDLMWIDSYMKENNIEGVDSIICDLGLSGLPEWENIIDNMLSILKPGGRIVILDWYLESSSLRGAFVKWIGKGQVDRKIWQYLKPRVTDFKLNDSFNRGGVFVASGKKIS